MFGTPIHGIGAGRSGLVRSRESGCGDTISSSQLIVK
jgi:hypothetical protein